MATVNIFEYNGIIGATSDIDNGKFVNDVQGDSQMGVVVDVNECSISQEAKDILLRSRREGGSFAPLMLTECSDGTACIGLLGFHVHLIEPVIGRTCSLSVLDKIPLIDNNPPQEFIEFVDGME